MQIEICYVHNCYLIINTTGADRIKKEVSNSLKVYSTLNILYLCNGTELYWL
jgi:hypothetical protein